MDRSPGPEAVTQRLARHHIAHAPSVPVPRKQDSFQNKCSISIRSSARLCLAHVDFSGLTSSRLFGYDGEPVTRYTPSHTQPRTTFGGQSNWQVGHGPCEDLSPSTLLVSLPLDLQLSCSVVGEKIGPFNMVPFATSLCPLGLHILLVHGALPSRDLQRQVAVKHRESKAPSPSLYRACVSTGLDTSDNIQQELSRFPWGPALIRSTRPCHEGVAVTVLAWLSLSARTTYRDCTNRTG